MKNQRKNLIILLLSIILLASCSEGLVLKENRISASDIEFVGIEHNNILEKTFVALKNEKTELKTKEKNTENHLERIITNVILDMDIYNIDQKAFAVKGVKDFFAVNDFLKKGTDVSTFEEQVALLGENEQKYLNDLNTIIESSEDDSLKEDIIVLEKLIEDDESLDNGQLLLLFSATQTAKYSSEFWEKNANSWIISLDDHDIDHIIDLSDKSTSSKPGYCSCGRPAKFNAAVGDVVKADAAGAIAGAVGAAAVNVIIGPGQLAYGTAIVATSATASAAAVANKFIDWLF